MLLKVCTVYSREGFFNSHFNRSIESWFFDRECCCCSVGNIAFFLFTPVVKFRVENYLFSGAAQESVSASLTLERNKILVKKDEDCLFNECKKREVSELSM